INYRRSHQHENDKCFLVLVGAYPEVIGIHVELLRVHSAQFGVGLSDVVQVLHSIFQTTHHGLPVLCHFGVSHNGSVGGQVSKFFEVSLTPGAHNQKPGIRQETEKITILIPIHLSPQAVAVFDTGGILVGGGITGIGKKK
uniref:Uncharacterized protein n=1 Tax=Maylandia zebra TaxID=106582 RepID=A0A3P9D504_9CICH